MTVSAATAGTKKIMKLGLSFFRRGFNASKCKTAAKMAVARIKLLRNKREAVVKQMRRDIALLLQSKQDATARIRVEHVIREQNVLAANEFIELFCELIVARLSIIAKQRDCPADLKEGISSVIFAAPRCSEIPELVALKDTFEKKYGKDFVSAATDLRPNAGVNRMLIEKLSVRTPTGQVKLKVMKEIAKEYQIDWDTTESEMELLKPPEERIEGPQTFSGATNLPLKHMPVQSVELNKPTTRSASYRETGIIHFEDTAEAAEAAADAAKKAIAAAQAAAFLASKDYNPFTQASHFDETSNASNHRPGSVALYGSTPGLSISHDSPLGYEKMDRQSKVLGRMYESQRFDKPQYPSHEESRPTTIEGGMASRRHSYNAPCGHSDIKFDESDHDPSEHSDVKFDESDCDEEIEMEQPPPQRPPPPVPSSLGKHDSVHRVHPKLPDYDDLAARFEALKHRKS